MKAKVSFVIRESIELEADDNITTNDLISMAAEQLTQGWDYNMDMWEFDGYDIVTP
jgi:hypothetical protein